MNQADTWGSIMAAAWSYMLAAHTRGLGVAWTSLSTMVSDEMLSTMVSDEIRALVGYPDNVCHACLMPALLHR